ncbi:MAG: hypothetical protein KDB80_02145 [Planctomycetes bacterium]|nr:hypothetical protein [Planctomycetota bacterium]
MQGSVLACAVCAVLAAPTPQTGGPEFHPAVRLEGGGKPIELEAPGYASPCLFDVDGDGEQDLVVGQFRDGKMTVFRGLGEGKFGAGEWLEAGGDVAQVPGVW